MWIKINNVWFNTDKFVSFRYDKETDETHVVIEYFRHEWEPELQDYIYKGQDEMIFEGGAAYAQLTQLISGKG